MFYYVLKLKYYPRIKIPFYIMLFLGHLPTDFKDTLSQHRNKEKMKCSIEEVEEDPKEGLWM